MKYYNSIISNIFWDKKIEIHIIYDSNLKYAKIVYECY